MPSICINDFLPSEILIFVFKWLNFEFVVVTRLVCRQWLQVIDESKSFWRIVELLEDSLQGHQSVIKQFDVKSDSTLKEVSIELNDDSDDYTYANSLQKFSTTLKKSSESLHKFCVQVAKQRSEDSNGLLEPLLQTLLPDLPRLEECRVLQEIQRYKVRVKREAAAKRTDGTQERHLQILWLPSLFELPSDHPKLLKSLRSLQVEKYYRHEEWRRILVQPSKTLRHLSIRIEKGRGERIEPLHFPCLEVLDVLELGNGFPNWMSVPLKLKLTTGSVYSRMPSSVSNLWVSHLRNYIYLTFRCPKLEVLRYDGNGLEAYATDLEQLLLERRDNVEKGLKVEGIKMEPLKRLLIPCDNFALETVGRFRNLVGEVVRYTAEEPRFWEVEI